MIVLSEADEKYIVNDHIHCMKAFTLYPCLYPIKVSYLPFFNILGNQIAKEIYKITGISSLKKFVFFLTVKRTEYEGDEYVERVDIPNIGSFEFTRNIHYGKMFKLRKDGYSYAKIDIDMKNDILSSYIWIRWKSLLLDYKYIDAENELNLKNTDILFEICNTVSDEFLLQLQARNSSELQICEWINFIKNAT